MKLYQSILTAFLLIVFSCDSEENNNELDTFPAYETDPNIELNDTTQLIIEGDNIWVRDEAGTGNVLMKLNTGDVCKILEKGEKIQVRDMLDHWYKISFNDTVGWVYGSQTNLKTGETIEIMGFSEYLTEFIAAFNDETVDLNYFQHENIESHVLFKNGLYCVEGSFEIIGRDISNPVPEKNSFDKKPKGDVCLGYPGHKDGFYYQKITSNELPEYTEDAESWVKIKVPEKYSNNELKKVIVITEEYHFAFMYFINIGSMWYLICQDFCDCSA